MKGQFYDGIHFAIFMATKMYRIVIVITLMTFFTFDFFLSRPKIILLLPRMKLYAIKPIKQSKSVFHS